MSDTSQGPGWWLASDGKWYPPEQWTGPPNAHPLAGQGSGTTQPSMPGQTPGSIPPSPEGQPVQPVQQAQPGPIGQAYPPGAPTPGPLPVAGPTWPGSAPSVPPGYAYPPTSQPIYVAPGGASTNGLAIASLVCSIVGIFFFTFIVAIILGFVARSQIRNSGGRQKGDGLAIAGIIIGFAWAAFYVLIIILGAVNNNTNSVITVIGSVGHHLVT